MVDATVDNIPVSIQLNGSSTTVPSNETWVVTITVFGGATETQFDLNGVGKMATSGTKADASTIDLDMVLTGGDTVKENKGGNSSLIAIQGFVVDS